MARFEMRLTEDEKERITQIARMYGMSTSTYVKSVALGYKPIPLVEVKHVNQLMEVNADLGRLGNLLKYWLSSDPKYQVATKMKIEKVLPKLLIEIAEEKLELFSIIKQIGKQFKMKK